MRVYVRTAVTGDSAAGESEGCQMPSIGILMVAREDRGRLCRKAGSTCVWTHVRNVESMGLGWLGISAGVERFE